MQFNPIATPPAIVHEIAAKPQNKTHIEKSDQIESINHFIGTSSDTLILLNIDIAVIESSIFLGSGPWYDYLKSKVAELEKKYPEMDTSFYYKILLYITQQVPVVGVEEATAPYIEELQKNHYPVLAFTGRGKDHLHGLQIKNYDKQTQNELTQAHIDFSKSEIPAQLQNLSEPYTLSNGIIFGGDAKKGPFLKALLENANYFPKKVIFASKLDHLTSTAQSMNELGIDFTGINYDYISENSHKFDVLTALIQLKHVFKENKVLSNEEANALKSEYKNQSIDELTEQLLLHFLDYLKEHPEFPSIE